MSVTCSRVCSCVVVMLSDTFPTCLSIRFTAVSRRSFSAGRLFFFMSTNTEGGRPIGKGVVIIASKNELSSGLSRLLCIMWRDCWRGFGGSPRTLRAAGRPGSPCIVPSGRLGACSGRVPAGALTTKSSVSAKDFVVVGTHCTRAWRTSPIESKSYVRVPFHSNTTKSTAVC